MTATLRALATRLHAARIALQAWAEAFSLGRCEVCESVRGVREGCPGCGG